MTINKVKASSYASVNSYSVSEYIVQYTKRINEAVKDGKCSGRLQKANKTQLNAIAAELETVCKRLDYILEGKY